MLLGGGLDADFPLAFGVLCGVLSQPQLVDGVLVGGCCGYLGLSFWLILPIIVLFLAFFFNIIELFLIVLVL